MKQGWFAAALAPFLAPRDHTTASVIPSNHTWDNVYDHNSVLSTIERLSHKEYLIGKRAIAPSLRPRAGPGQGDCHSFPEGAAPLPDKLNVGSFVDFSGYSALANSAATPNDYVRAFKNYNTSVSSPYYLGVVTVSSYDPNLCAKYCDNDPSCQSFDIYVSRDPSKDPGPKCPNPPATANFKCTLFTAPVSAGLATNQGQILPPADTKGKEFGVKIRASNGYNKNATSEYSTYMNPRFAIDEYIGPETLPAAIDTSDTDHSTLIGTQYFNTTYQPELCAKLCDGVTQVRRFKTEQECGMRKTAVNCTWDPCNYFNTYSLTEQAGFHCSLFTQSMPASQASVRNAVGFTGRTGPVANSWAYSRTEPFNNTIEGPASGNYHAVHDVADYATKTTVTYTQVVPSPVTIISSHIKTHTETQTFIMEDPFYVTRIKTVTAQPSPKNAHVTTVYHYVTAAARALDKRNVPNLKRQDEDEDQDSNSVSGATTTTLVQSTVSTTVVSSDTVPQSTITETEISTSSTTTLGASNSSAAPQQTSYVYVNAPSSTTSSVQYSIYTVTATSTVPASTITDTVTQISTEVSTSTITDNDTVTETSTVAGSTITESVVPTSTVPGPTVTESVVSITITDSNTVTQVSTIQGPTVTESVVRISTVTGPTVTDTVTSMSTITDNNTVTQISTVPGPTVTDTFVEVSTQTLTQTSTVTSVSSSPYTFTYQSAPTSEPGPSTVDTVVESTPTPEPESSSAVSSPAPPTASSIESTDSAASASASSNVQSTAAPTTEIPSATSVSSFSTLTATNSSTAASTASSTIPATTTSTGISSSCSNYTQSLETLLTYAQQQGVANDQLLNRVHRLEQAIGNINNTIYNFDQTSGANISDVKAAIAALLSQAEANSTSVQRSLADIDETVNNVRDKSGTSALRRRYMNLARSTCCTTVDAIQAKLQQLQNELAGNLTIVQTGLVGLHTDLTAIQNALNIGSSSDSSNTGDGSNGDSSNDQGLNSDSGDQSTGDQDGDSNNDDGSGDDTSDSQDGSSDTNDKPSDSGSDSNSQSSDGSSDSNDQSSDDGSNSNDQSSDDESGSNNQSSGDNDDDSSNPNTETPDTKSSSDDGTDQDQNPDSSSSDPNANVPDTSSGSDDGTDQGQDTDSSSSDPNADTPDTNPSSDDGTSQDQNTQSSSSNSNADVPDTSSGSDDGTGQDQSNNSGTTDNGNQSQSSSSDDDSSGSSDRTERLIAPRPYRAKISLQGRRRSRSP